MKKNEMWKLVSDLIDELKNHGADPDLIIHILKYYGLTDEEIKEWYNLPFSTDEGFKDE